MPNFLLFDVFRQTLKIPGENPVLPIWRCMYQYHKKKQNMPAENRPTTFLSLYDYTVVVWWKDVGFSDWYTCHNIMRLNIWIRVIKYWPCSAIIIITIDSLVKIDKNVTVLMKYQSQSHHYYEEIEYLLCHCQNIFVWW